MKSCIFKRIMFLFIFGLLTFSIFSFKAVAATNDTGTATYTKTSTVSSLNTLYSSYTTDKGLTTYNSVSSEQQVHVFSQQQTSNSKVVSWAVSSDAGGFKRTNVGAIALDYELNHPGWKVVGGINADQYVQYFGTDVPAKGADYYYPQPYYTMIADGEGWFVMTAIPTSGGQSIAAFLQDGSADSIISGTSNLNSGSLNIVGMYLYILDENDNKLEKFEVNKFNESPLADETTLWTSFYDSNHEFKDITVYGNLFVVDKAIRAYASNSIDYTYKGTNAQNAFFGKGYITRSCTEATIGYGDFAISSNDSNVLKALSVGKKIMVQYELSNGFSNVEAAVGYHTVQMDNDVDNEISQSNTYNTRQYPRAIVGRKSNGDIVLIAIDGLQESKGYCGANFWEINAILKEYGVVEAYQMDGGGSVTAVVANSKGGFDVVNSPSDGAPRSVLSALLIVERREPIATITIDSYLNNGIYVKLNCLDYGRTLTNINLEINTKEYKMNDELLFLELAHNQSYEYKITIEEDDGKVYNIAGILDVGVSIPEFKSCIRDGTSDDYTFVCQFIDYDSIITSYCIYMNAESYYPNDQGVITINKSIGVIYLKYTYEISGKKTTITIIYPYSPLLQASDVIYGSVFSAINNSPIF